MSASDHLSSEQFEPQLLHGSPHGIPIGGTVHPGEGLHGYGAYATDDVGLARGYARRSPYEDYEGQLPLFGSIYKVEPWAGEPSEKVGNHVWLGEKGYRVSGIHSHVIPWKQEELAKEHGIE